MLDALQTKKEVINVGFQVIEVLGEIGSLAFRLNVVNRTGAEAAWNTVGQRVLSFEFEANVLRDS